ncbi:hypothetical protein PHYPSEUDO_005818 [Phytophthora pseudosyringae]|uniref:Chromo domain-containing protein n=1 Tax=Phytophthora pseudosyringae TaxID=221518 RepID=A0A8T1VN05_9STRA|nr:hypothetical protein PHYPSEUDO_005818 [Phytophthora pseudosyringae]
MPPYDSSDLRHATITTAKPDDTPSMIISPTKTDPPFTVVPAELAPLRIRPRAVSDTAEPACTILTEQDPQEDIGPVIAYCLDQVISSIESHFEELDQAEVRALDEEFSADPPDTLSWSSPPIDYLWDFMPRPADISPTEAIIKDTLFRMVVMVERSYERLGLAAERYDEGSLTEDPYLVEAKYIITPPTPKSTNTPHTSSDPANAPGTSGPPVSKTPHSALGMRLRSGSARVAQGLTEMTTEQFPLIIIDDRRDEPKRGRCYHVRFLDGHEEWIPRQHLVDDDQAEPCDWVDWWYDDDEQQPKPYICYMKGLSEYYDYMTASEGGDCVVQAINALYKIAGHPPPLINQPNWEDFCFSNDVHADVGSP